MNDKILSAAALKNEMWNTLQGVKDRSVDLDTANTIARLAIGITQTVKAEVDVHNANRQVDEDAGFFPDREKLRGFNL